MGSILTKVIWWKWKQVAGGGWRCLNLERRSFGNKRLFSLPHLVYTIFPSRALFGFSVHDLNSHPNFHQSLCFKSLYSFNDEVSPRSIQSIFFQTNLVILSIFFDFRVGKPQNQYDRFGMRPSRNLHYHGRQNTWAYNVYSYTSSMMKFQLLLMAYCTS